jgi:hypothetical protein
MTPTRCPSDFSLDDLELHGPATTLAAHLAGCARCATRRQQRASLAAEFRNTAADAVWAAVQLRTAPGARRRSVKLGLLALAAAAGLVLVAGLSLRPPVRDREVESVAYVGIKGRPGLDIVCRRQTRTFRLEPGQPLQPGDELRFRAVGTPPDARYLVLGSVDGTGRFAPFYPNDMGQPSVPLPPPEQALPGGVTIDEAPGPERLLLVVSDRPVSARAVARAAEAGAATGRFPAIIDGVAVASRWLPLPKQGHR